MDRIPILSFTYPGLRDYCRKGSRKIGRAREEVQDHMEIELYKLLGPWSYEFTAIMSAQDPCKLKQTIT